MKKKAKCVRITFPVVLQMYVNDKQSRKVKRAAKKSGMTVTAFMRALIEGIR